METITLANTSLLRDKYMQTVEFLKQIPSIARVIWIDQTNSSGDWSGIIVEKASDDTYNLLEFFQERGEEGMRIFIGNPITRKPVFKGLIEGIVSEYVDCFYSSDDDFCENETIEDIPPKIRKQENVVALKIPFE